MEEPTGARPSVVIVGAGFAGLRLARGLSRAPVDVTVRSQRAGVVRRSIVLAAGSS